MKFVRIWSNLIALFSIVWFIIGISNCWGDEMKQYDSPSNPLYPVKKIADGMIMLTIASLSCTYYVICYVLCCLCCMMMLMGAAAREEAMGRMRDNGLLSRVPMVKNVLDKNTRKFNKETDAGEMCIICMDEFSEEDKREIAELNCSGKHIFHLECI